MRLTRNQVVVLLAFTLFLGLPLLDEAQTGQSTLGPVGTVWGGTHVGLEVTSEGATLEFDCASGTMTQAAKLDAKGNFEVPGTFTREHPGPVMRDGNGAASAMYSGSIQGNTMKLRITSGPQHEDMGDFVLVRGKQGRVFKCK